MKKYATVKIQGGKNNLFSAELGKDADSFQCKSIEERYKE